MEKVPFKKGDLVEAVIATSSHCANARFTVEEVGTKGYLKFHGMVGWHSCALYKKVERDTIVITTDGNVGEAKLIRGGKLQKKVTLKRDKGDKHDMKALAAYAVQKLIPDDGNVIINVKAGYTGSVAVVNSKNPMYADGKILEFVTGDCITVKLPFCSEKLMNFDNVKSYFKRSHYNFDVVELHRR